MEDLVQALAALQESNEPLNVVGHSAVGGDCRLESVGKDCISLITKEGGAREAGARVVVPFSAVHSIVFAKGRNYLYLLRAEPPWSTVRTVSRG